MDSSHDTRLPWHQFHSAFSLAVTLKHESTPCSINGGELWREMHGYAPDSDRLTARYELLYLNETRISNGLGRATMRVEPAVHLQELGCRWGQGVGEREENHPRKERSSSQVGTRALDGT